MVVKAFLWIDSLSRGQKYALVCALVGILILLIVWLARPNRRDIAPSRHMFKQGEKRFSQLVKVLGCKHIADSDVEKVRNEVAAILGSVFSRDVYFLLAASRKSGRTQLIATLQRIECETRSARPYSAPLSF